MGVNIEELTEFLYEASKPHAFGTSNAKSMPDGSTTITWEKDDWSFHDNFFGGQPFGGRAVIFYKQKPVWMMVYYGQVHNAAEKSKEVYTFLRTALQHAPKDKPYRGPDHFEQDAHEYRNHVEGTMESYSGKEVILENGQEIYWATYQGGLIDQTPGIGF